MEVANISDDSVTLSWLSPESQGGGRIRSYMVEMRDMTRTDGWRTVKEVDASDILVCVVENLREGIPYKFRVCAVNEAGKGPVTELTDAVAPRSQLGKEQMISINLVS